MKRLTNEQVKYILTTLVQEDELHAGGVSAHEQELIDDYGLTPRQAATLQVRIINLIRFTKGDIK